MKNAITISLFIVLSLTASNGISNVQINSELAIFENNLQNQIYKAIEVYLGESSKFILSVSAKESPIFEEEKKNTTIDQIENKIDVGYLPFPIDPIVHKDKKDNSIKEEKKRSLTIDTININLRVSEKVSSKSLEEIRRIIRDLTVGLNPQIRMTKVIFPISPSTPEAPKVETPLPKENKGQPQPEGLTKEAPKKKNTLDNEMPYLEPALWFLGIISFLFGFILISRALKTGLFQMANSLNYNQKDNALSQNVTKLELENNTQSKSETDIVKNNSSLIENENFKIYINKIKSMLDTNLLSVITTIGSTKSELQNLRWLLSHLSQNHISAIYKSLGTQRFQYMETLPQQTDQAELLSWLQNLVERANLKQLKGETLVTKTLSKDDLSLIFSLEPETILLLSSEISNPGSWRILAETMSSEDFQNILKRIDFDSLQAALESYNCTEEDIRNGYDELYGIIKKQQDDSQSEINFFSQNLKTPLIQFFEAQPFSKENDLLTKMAASNPLVYEQIKDQVWTAQHVLKIPEQKLKPIVNTLSNEQLFAVVYSFPQEASEKILELIPDGRKKSIVMDLVEKAQKNPDVKAAKSALNISKKFVIYLKSQHQEGEFNLTSQRVSNAV